MIDPISRGKRVQAPSRTLAIALPDAPGKRRKPALPNVNDSKARALQASALIMLLGALLTRRMTPWRQI